MCYTKNMETTSPSEHVKADFIPLMLFAVQAQSKIDQTAAALRLIFSHLLRSITPILHNSSPDSIEFSIDEVLEDEKFTNQYIRFCDLAKKSIKVPSEKDISHTVSCISIPSHEKDKLYLILKYASIISGAVTNHRSENQESSQTDCSNRVLLWFLDEWSLPSEIKLRMLNLMRAEVALMCFFCAIDDQPCAEWKRHHFLSISQSGYKQYAELLASYPIFGVTEEQIPLSDRLNVEELSQQEINSRIAKELVVIKFEQGGKNPYAPFGEITNDDY